MFISHKYKTIFIHIQKTGGSSIQRLFEQLDSELVTKIPIDPTKKRPKHCFASDIEAIVGTEMFSDYTKFCVVRNPFDRLVSWYWMLKLRSFEEENPEIVETEGSKVNFSLIEALNRNASNFDEFINLSRKHKKGLFERFFVNQLDYISNDDIVIVDRILKFENLANDFSRFAKDLKIQGQLPHMNKTPRKSGFQTYYNETSRQAIAERFQRDLDYFNYTF